MSQRFSKSLSTAQLNHTVELCVPAHERAASKPKPAGQRKTRATLGNCASKMHVKMQLRESNMMDRIGISFLLDKEREILDSYFTRIALSGLSSKVDTEHRMVR